MGNFYFRLNDGFIETIQYESLSVFHKYNKAISEEYKKWKNIFNIFNKYALKLEKSIDVIVKKSFFGFHSQGMRLIEQDKIIIKIWGIHPPHLIHELVHCYFASKNKSLHEGFADYIQNLLNIDKIREKVKLNNKKVLAIDKLIEIINQIIILKKINSPSILYKMWSNYEYYNDTRYFNMFVARMISMLFVSFLIEKFGIEIYFNKFHYNQVNLNLENELLNLFYEFYSLNFNDEIAINKKINHIYRKYQFYIKKWNYFNKFDLPSIGNPMAYLNKCNIDKKENKKAIKIYKKELKLYNKILKFLN